MKKSILFYFLLTTLWLHGQVHSTFTYTIEDGIPHTEIAAVHQDSKGYLWMTTTSLGIARFDGREFKKFSSEDGVPFNAYAHIFEDKEGGVWFFGSIGATRYFEDKFTSFKFSKYNVTGGKIHPNGIPYIHGTDCLYWVFNFSKQEFEKEKHIRTTTLYHSNKLIFSGK